MALPTYYATGTASVANGSTDVTGSGTSWLTSIRAGDLFGTHKGMPVRIATVNSNTSLTLAYGWAGTTQTDAAYEIQLTPRTVGVQQAVLDLLEHLSNGNLSSIAELTSAADKLPYFTGAGTSALTDITSKARSLLGNSTTLDMLATLGPVFGGTAPVPSSAGVGLADGNFNTIAIPGVYTIDGAWTNGPLAAGASAAYAGVLVVTASSLDNGYWQELLIDDQRFMRFTSTSGGGSGWSAWTEMSSGGTGGSLPTPTTGDAGKVVAVNATEDGFELDTLPASPLPIPTTGDAGKVVAVNATEDGYDLEALTRLPAPTVGNAGKIPGVNAAGNGYELLLRREVLTANRTYYVRADGSDSNNGLANTAGGAFLTIQKAINTVATLDLSIYNVTIQVGNGTYTGGASVNGKWIGSGSVTLLGTTPASCVISTTSAHAITAGNGGLLRVGGFKLQTTGSGCGIFAYAGSNVVAVGSMEYGSCAQAHIQLSGSQFTNNAVNYTISGGATSHIILDGYSYCQNVSSTITITGTPAFSSSFINCSGSFIQCNANTFSGSATGARYSVTANGIIQTFGGGASYLPGNAVGSTATQGQYI